MIDEAKILNSSLGAEFDEEDARILATRMKALTLNNGEQLVEEGDTDTNLYLLVDGQLEVLNAEGDEQRLAYTMHPGEYAGMRAFIDGKPRMATLRSVGRSKVYAIGPDAFETLVEPYPRLVYKVMRSFFRTAHTNLLRKNFESEELTHYVMKTHGRY